MKRPPSTPALRYLRAEGVDFKPYFYRYVERGGTRASSRALGVEEHLVIKTLVFETDAGAPLIVLMHGDRSVSAKELAREVGVKAVAACEPAVAERHTGYRVGGTSPFGLRKPLPIYAEHSILGRARVYVNAGQRGWLVGMRSEVLDALLGPRWVKVARDR